MVSRECALELDSNSAVKALSKTVVSRQACICPGCFVSSSFFLWLFILVSKACANNGDLIKENEKHAEKRKTTIKSQQHKAKQQSRCSGLSRNLQA